MELQQMGSLILHNDKLDITVGQTYAIDGHGQSRWKTLAQYKIFKEGRE